MGCICMSSPNLNSDYFECSLITLRFSSVSSTESESLPFYSPHKAISRYPSHCSSPTSDSVSIPRLQKPVQPTRSTIHSGDLQKYNPGSSSKFQSCYCVLTPKDLKYYKSSVSYSINDKPIFTLPLNQIDSANNFNISNNIKDLSSLPGNSKYLFEVSIKSSIESSRTDKNFTSDNVFDCKNYQKSVESKKRHLSLVNLRQEEGKYSASQEKLIFAVNSFQSACHWVSEIESLLS